MSRDGGPAKHTCRPGCWCKPPKRGNGKSRRWYGRQLKSVEALAKVEERGA